MYIATNFFYSTSIALTPDHWFLFLWSLRSSNNHLFINLVWQVSCRALFGLLSSSRGFKKILLKTMMQLEKHNCKCSVLAVGVPVLGKEGDMKYLKHGGLKSTIPPFKGFKGSKFNS